MLSQLLLQVPSSKCYRHTNLELKFPTHGILVSKVKHLQVGSTKLNICKHRYYHVSCTPVREKGTWHSIQLAWPWALFLEHPSYGRQDSGAPLCTVWEVLQWRHRGLPNPQWQRLGQAWGSGGLISRLSVNQGLSQFDRVVDNSKLGAGDGELTRLFQGWKEAPLHQPWAKKM